MGEYSAGAYAGAVADAGLPVFHESPPEGGLASSVPEALHVLADSADPEGTDAAGLQIEGSGPPEPALALPSMAQLSASTNLRIGGSTAKT